MLKQRSLFILAASALFFASCGSDANKNGENGTDTGAVSNANDTNKINDLTEFKYDLVISNVPIPFDILSTLNKSGVTYNKSVLNDPANVERYNKSDIKAVNLGIYGGDLAYVISFEQYPEVGTYLKSTKKLADALGIPIAFDQNALANYEKYKDNKDSLSKIIFSSYNEVDKTLKSNERIGLASLVVTGGWIEGLYTTVKTLNGAAMTDGNKKLYNKILEQRVHLEKLIGLLNEFSSQDTFFASLITDLESLKSIYDGLASKTALTPAELDTITKKIDEIRWRITNG